mgnify:CR=1 FL=1
MLDIKLLKEDILKIIRNDGPVLPIQLSRRLNKDTIFAGAILSELVKDRHVKVSNAKIGGSPVYYVVGQEAKLNILYGHLPGKEKEAYESLRKNQILKDKDCEPAIRIALRSITDFAFPFDNNGELYWRWYLIDENNARELVKPGEVFIEKKIEKPAIRQQAFLVSEKKPDTRDEFFENVLDYLNNKGIKVIDINAIRKKREVQSKVYINSDLGILEYLCLAKNKKTINDADLSLANDAGRKYKLPVLFLSNGDLTKKSEKYLNENLKGRIIFRKI